MPDIKLTKLEYADSGIHAYFALDADFDTEAFRQGLPGAFLSATVVFPSATVVFPDSPGGPPQPGTERQAHAQLLEHLEEFVQELREILKE